MQRVWLNGKYGSIVGRYALVDDGDYELVNQHKWYAEKTPRTYYAVRGLNGGHQKIRMHQMIFGSHDVDHKDRNGLNNQRYNLREATATQQTRNRGANANAKSQYKGVCWHAANSKWRPRIRVNRKFISLGLYEEEIEAARAYDRAALEYFGEFAVLNFPPEENTES